MAKQYFGTDGIRGPVGKTPITADFFLRLGWAVGKVLSKYDNPTVVIGKDPRISGYMLESALQAGFTSAGVDVVLIGPMPTPAVAYLTKTYHATAGAVISASHNSYTDNGIKFFSNLGFKLSNSNQKEIEAMLDKPMLSVASEQIGKAKRADQAEGRYIEFCKSTFNKKLSLSGLKIILDCANGATYNIAPYVFSELGAQVLTINNAPDGLNINANCGATDVRSLQEKVLQEKANLGIAFDGDGDRVIMVDHNGRKVDGDELLFIIAQYKHQHKLLKNNAVVGTKMTNLGIIASLKSLGIGFYQSEVGDRFVMQTMQENSIILGGEGSGHIITLNHVSSGDAIVSALQVLVSMVANRSSLADLTSSINKTHQILINVATSKKVNLENLVLSEKTKNIQTQLGDTGRILIRPSGTEPLVRVMVEGVDESFVQQSAQDLADIITNLTHPI